MDAKHNYRQAIVFLGHVWQGFTLALALVAPPQLCQTFFLHKLFFIKNRGAGAVFARSPS